MEVINQHRSIRKYSNKEISNDLLKKLVEEAERTQTMGNLQLYSVVITRTEEMKKALYTTIVILAALLIAHIATLRKVRAEKERLEANQTALLSQVEYWTTKSGKNAADVRKLTLTANEPIAQTVVHATLTKAFSLGLIHNSRHSSVHFHTGEFAGVNQHAFLFLVGAGHLF